jgi:hypothetical protein
MADLRAALVLGWVALAAGCGGGSAGTADTAGPSSITQEGGGDATLLSPEVAVPVDAGPPDAPAALDGARDVELMPKDGSGEETKDEGPLPIARLVVDRMTIDAGTVHIGCTGRTEQVQVSNAGDGTSGALSVTLSGEYTIVGDQCRGSALAPGQSCGIDIIFSPVTAPARSAGVLQIAAQPGGTLEVKLSGAVLIGVAPLIVQPEAVRFGAVAVGAALSRGMRAISDGSSTVAFSVQSSSPEFVITKNGCSGARVPAGQWCEIEVSFRPTSVGEKSATLTVSTFGSCGRGFLSAALSGTADAPAPAKARLVLDPPAVDWLVPAGCSQSTLESITNTGAAPSGPLTVATQAPFSITANGCGGAVLAPGATCNFELKLVEPPLGKQTAKVLVSAEPGGSLEASLAALVYTAEAAFVVTPSFQDLGSVKVGASVEAKLTVSVWAGSAPVAGFSVVSSSLEFLVTKNDCDGVTLQGGQWCNIDVSFRPTSLGQKSAQITITTPRICSQPDTVVVFGGQGVP